MAKRKKITKGTVNFILKTKKLSIDGLAPLFLRYSFKGVPTEYSLKKSIIPYNWDDEGKEPVFISKAIAKKIDPTIKYSLFCSNSEVQDIIALMNEIELEIKDVETKLTEISSDAVIHQLKINRGDIILPAVEDKSNKYFTDFMAEYNESMRSIIKYSTWKVYNTMANMVIDYESKMGRRFLISEIDYNYMGGLCNHMANDLHLLNSTIERRLKNTKGFVEKARKKGYLIDYSYKDFSWSDNETEVFALTCEDIIVLENLDLSELKYLERVKDCFLFACYTGLRFSDLKALKKVNIIDTGIRLTTQKTSAKQFIPLTEKARNLISKYHSEDNDHIFPVCSNQKFNEYLKIIGKKAGFVQLIEKVRFSGAKRITEVKYKWELLTVHAARKTFSTLSMEFGMEAFEVMSITGHKDYKTFKKYYKVTEKKVSKSLLKAWNI